MAKSVTVAVRLPQEIRKLLEEKALLGNSSSLTSLLRDVLTEFALDSSHRESERAEVCKQQEVGFGHDNRCPLLSFARSELCNACPWREQPIVSREDAIPSPASSSNDSVDQLAQRLYDIGLQHIKSGSMGKKT